MTSPMEERLREALREAGAAVDPATLRPLAAPAGRRVRVDLRLVAAAAVVVLGGAGAFVATRSGGEITQVAVMPSQGAAVVHLCNGSAPAGHCAGPSTAAQVTSIGELLRRQPSVRKVAFEDQAQALRNFREQNADLAKSVKATDLPASFRVTMKPGADPLPLALAISRAAGVSTVISVRGASEYPRQTDAWVWGKPVGLDRVPGVASVTLSQTVISGKAEPPVYGVVFRRGADAAATVRAVGRLPGVDRYWDGRCSSPDPEVKRKAVDCAKSWSTLPPSPG